jgi:putative two-component system response regulator
LNQDKTPFVTGTPVSLGKDGQGKPLPENAIVIERTESLVNALKNKTKISLETIYRVSRAAEFHDEDTDGHIERMSHYSTAVARKLGLDETFRQNILFAAPLHDVGNIAIPDDMLHKPGKLNQDEWEIMRRHSPFGARILEEFEAEFSKMAEEIAATHHEKWNGSGYPLGLKGNGIPLAGRIVAVTDTFDVLTWERPYKPALPLQEAFTVIREGSGTNFDPVIVDAFFGIKDEVISEFNWWKFMGDDSDPL